MMHPSNNDSQDNIGTDHKSQMESNSASSTLSKSIESQPSNSADVETGCNSDENSANAPPKAVSTLVSNTVNHSTLSVSMSSASIFDPSNNTAEQQRRRNSSIAKLLTGHSLNKQQYEEINQQILDDQSAQNQNHNGENRIPRSRSSITRKMLMNPERNNNQQTTPPHTQTSSKGCEYLIREIYNEHSTRYDTPSNIVPNQNLNYSRLKCKKSIPKATSTSIHRHSSSHPPFALNELAEQDEPKEISPNPIDMMSRKHRRDTNESLKSIIHPHRRHNLHAALYNPYYIPQDRITGCQRSFSCNYSHYPTTALKVNFPSYSSRGLIPTVTDDAGPHLGQRFKPTRHRSDSPDLIRPRSYSSVSNKTDPSLSEPNIPLKKRLLNAYKTEQDSIPPL